MAIVLGKLGGADNGALVDKAPDPAVLRTNNRREPPAEIKTLGILPEKA